MLIECRQCGATREHDHTMKLYSVKCDDCGTLGNWEGLRHVKCESCGHHDQSVIVTCELEHLSCEECGEVGCFYALPF